MKMQFSGIKRRARRHFLAIMALATTVLALPLLATQTLAADAKKPLVVYYSESGNTQKVAEEIHKLVGGDILRIEPATPYPTNYKELTEVAKEEQNKNARPAIKTAIPDMSQYGLIFLGYPNWWSSMPMPVYTFVEKADLKNISIAPFDTHGGGGLGHSIEDLKKIAPQCKILDPLAISGDRKSVV